MAFVIASIVVPIIVVKSIRKKKKLNEMITAAHENNGPPSYSREIDPESLKKDHQDTLRGLEKNG